MSEKSLVSIAMGAFNGERFLRKQLDSIYNQTYKNLEVIVTDDCSNDGTLKILEEYKQKYGLAYYVNKERLGFKKNFERALSYCRGEYIAFSDQDDIWLPEKIETFVREIGDYSMIFSDLSVIDADDKIIIPSFIECRGVKIPKPEKIRIFLNFDNFINGCASLFRKELLKEALPIPEHAVFHDWWIAMVAVRQQGIKFINKQFVMYRRLDDSITGFEKRKSPLSLIVKYFNADHRRWWNNERMKLKSVLERSLKTRLPLLTDEEKIISECIFYLDCFLKGIFNFKFFIYGWKYKEYFFKRKKYFWMEYLAYFNNIFRKLLFKEELPL